MALWARARARHRAEIYGQVQLEFELELGLAHIRGEPSRETRLPSTHLPLVLIVLDSFHNIKRVISYNNIK